MTDAQKWAIIKIQARFRGWLTRKRVKQAYGFVCRKGPSNTVTGTKEEIAAARLHVVKIRESLEKFDYNPLPQGYN
jgi:hypothetical protein